MVVRQRMERHYGGETLGLRNTRLVIQRVERCYGGKTLGSRDTRLVQH